MVAGDGGTEVEDPGSGLLPQGPGESFLHNLRAPTGGGASPAP